VSWGLFICMAIYTAMFSCPFRDTRVGNMLTQLSIVFLMTKTQLTQHYIWSIPASDFWASTKLCSQCRHHMWPCGIADI
jgi:hypothetical protein